MLVAKASSSNSSEFTHVSLQEIYPPKSTEFAYVADGAFEVEDIHEFELVMMKVLHGCL